MRLISNTVLRDREIIGSLVDISVHLIVAAIGAGLVYLYSGSLFYAALFATAGVLIDLDHLIDYFIYYKRGFDLKKFFRNHCLVSGKMYVFLHSWELVLIIFVLGGALGSYGVLIFAAGLAVHVLSDSIMRRNALLYFFLYRAVNGFDTNKVLRPK